MCKSGRRGLETFTSTATFSKLPSRLDSARQLCLCSAKNFTFTVEANVRLHLPVVRQGNWTYTAHCNWIFKVECSFSQRKQTDWDVAISSARNLSLRCRVQLHMWSSNKLQCHMIARMQFKTWLYSASSWHHSAVGVWMQRDPWDRDTVLTIKMATDVTLPWDQVGPFARSCPEDTSAAPPPPTTSRWLSGPTVSAKFLVL